MKSNFKKKVLKNGMTVLFEKRELPVVSVSVSVRCGGINESLKEKGISHFVEHMMYKGTKKRTALDISSEIEKNGGELNGFTTENLTSFWCKIPSRHLDVALDVLSDMVLNSKFDEEEIEKERKVIFQEIKMRKDSPRHYVFDKLQSLLYSGTLGEDLIGTKKIMNSIGKKQLLKRFEEVYVPENMILSVVGEANFDDIVEWAEKTFKAKKGNVPTFEIGLKNDSKIKKRKGIDQANLVFAFHSPLATDEKVYAAEVLATLMGGGMSSRLFTEIREKRNLAYSIHADLDACAHYSHTVVLAGTNSKNVDKIKKLILEEFQKVSEDLTPKKLEEIKEQLIGNFQISMEDSQSQMIHLLASEMDTVAEDFYDYDEKISAVKIDDVKELASEVYEGNYSFFALVPDED